MGIFDRFSTMLRSNLNDLISRAENPEKMLNQLIVDMKTQLAKAKQQVASAIADMKKVQHDAESSRKQAEDWERRAMLAVQEGRDDLAKQALMRFNEHLQTAQQLHETHTKQKAEVESLKNSLRQLNDKIEEAKRKKNILVARARRAEAQKRIQETMAGLSDKSAFHSFDQMAERIEETERRALAAAELNEEFEGDSLSAEFQALEYHGSSDQQLLELKSKMGVLKAGEAPKQLGDGDDDVSEAEVLEEESDQPTIALSFLSVLGALRTPHPVPRTSEPHAPTPLLDIGRRRLRPHDFQDRQLRDPLLRGACGGGARPRPSGGHSRVGAGVRRGHSCCRIDRRRAGAGT